ncbi:phage tail protein [Chromobacterium violaceum]
MRRVGDNRNPVRDKFGAGKHGFGPGDPQTGQPATTPGYELFDSWQEEIASVVEGAGFALKPDQNNQLLQAIRAIAWGNTASRPTTLSGYGITDAASKTDLQNALVPMAPLDNPTFTRRVTVPEGTVKAPGITFALDGSGDTGFWHIADGFIGIACNGVEAGRFGPDGMILPASPPGANDPQPASHAFVQTAITALIGAAPASLNTLAKLGDALGDDPNFATSVTSALAGKASTAAAVAAAPPGLVGFFAGPAEPAGWLRANGAPVSRSTYAALFASIGTIYGAGDGSTTFNLPDLRGEFVRGWDYGRLVDTGRTLGSNQSDVVGPHDHTIKRPQDGGTLAIPGASGTSWSYAGSVASSNQTPLITGTNAGTGTETRPRNVALLACIKF